MIKIIPDDSVDGVEPFFFMHGSDIRQTEHGYVFKNVYGDYFAISEKEMQNIIFSFTNPKTKV